MRALAALRRLEGRRRLERRDVPLELVRGPWRALVATADGGVHRGAYALWVLEHLCEGLRRRDGLRQPQPALGRPRPTLLSGAAWEAARAARLAAVLGALDGCAQRSRPLPEEPIFEWNVTCSLDSAPQLHE
ncbi:MAG: hypothetical protein QOH00_2312 [Gaiellales bacterium]|nr:hypothetical protein [Gaiellales bacterium]